MFDTPLSSFFSPFSPQVHSLFPPKTVISLKSQNGPPSVGQNAIMTVINTLKKEKRHGIVCLTTSLFKWQEIFLWSSFARQSFSDPRFFKKGRASNTWASPRWSDTCTKKFCSVVKKGIMPWHFYKAVFFFADHK